MPINDDAVIEYVEIKQLLNDQAPIEVSHKLITEKHIEEEA